MKLVAYYNDAVFVVTNILMQLRVIKDKYQRREIASKLYIGMGKHFAEPTWISKKWVEKQERMGK